jgi:hypothetical protein
MQPSRLLLAFGLFAVATTLVPAPANAERRGHERRGHEYRGHERYEHRHQERNFQRWDRHGDIRHFRRRDFDHWRGGRWYHGHHDGRLGWWWIIGGLWYFYPAPVYPYPDPYVPPTRVVPVPPPPGRYYYYCVPYRDYYPYVTSCPRGGWTLVPAYPKPPGVR